MSVCLILSKLKAKGYKYDTNSQSLLSKHPAVRNFGECFRTIMFCGFNRKKLLEILNGGIDPPIMIFVNQKKVR